MGRGGIAEVSGHGPQLLRIEPIIKAVFQALQSRPARGLLVWFDECCGRGIPPFRTEKPAATRPPVMFGTLCPKGQASFSSLRRGPTVAGRTDVHILLSLGHHLVPACGDEQHENGCAPLQASGLMFAVQAGLFHLLSPRWARPSRHRPERSCRTAKRRRTAPPSGHGISSFLNLLFLSGRGGL